MFSWQFNSKKDKNPTWYMVAAIISLAVIIWGYIIGLYLMSIVVFILSGVYVLIENNAPDTVEVHVSDLGIQIGTDFFDYGKLDSFSIIYREVIPVILRLKFNMGNFRIIDLPLNRTVDSAKLREWLLQFTKEDAQSEFTKTDKLIDFLKI